MSKSFVFCSCQTERDGNCDELSAASLEIRSGDVMKLLSSDDCFGKDFPGRKKRHGHEVGEALQNF